MAERRRPPDSQPSGVGQVHAFRRHAVLGGVLNVSAEMFDESGRTMRSPRVLVYSHDGVGLGHLRRALNICEHVGSVHPDASFLIATGSPYLSLFEHGPRVDFVKLPALRKVDNDTYRSKYLDLAGDPLMHFRESLLLEAARHFHPDVLLVDKAPVGVCGELVATLLWLRRRCPGARIIFGMRDIEDAPDETIRQWSRLGAPSMLEEYYDELWVYGMRDVFDVVREYKLPERMGSNIRFMGYLARPSCNHSVSSSDGVPRVLVTVGGGTDGASVLGTYLAESARELAASGLRSILVSGPDLPMSDADRLSHTARRIPGVEWVDFEPCMYCRIREAELVVSMGGYNTLCEIALSRKPALVIPRTAPRVEQAIRADLWAHRGAVHVLAAPELAPSALARRVNEMLERGPKVTAPTLDFGGLDRVRRRFDAFWGEEERHAARVCLQ